MPVRKVFICGHRESRHLLGFLSKAFVKRGIDASRYFGGDMAILSSCPKMLRGHILILGLCAASRDENSVEWRAERSLLHQTHYDVEVCIVPDSKGIVGASHITESGSHVAWLVVRETVGGGGIDPANTLRESAEIYVAGNPTEDAEDIAAILAPKARA